MSIIQIRRVKRGNARLLIVFASWTGEGKTYTAIQLGYGLANYDASKLGLLDTENRRGSLYDDILEKSTRPTTDRFLIADLHPPFTPRRYSGAIDEFQETGIEVLIVDSASHEWEGTGGCQEIAEAGNPKMPNWNLAKKEHKSFMNKLLQADMHIIVCVRAREKTKPEKQEGKTVFVDYGLQPIQEKNFMFEATASFMMHDKGQTQSIIKCPAALINILGRQKGYITADDGKMLRDWVDGAIQLDPVVEKFRNRLISNTEGGVKHIEDCWNKTPEGIRQALGEAFHGNIVASAQSYDQLKADAEAAQNAEGGGGNDAGGTPIAGAGERLSPEDSAAASAIADRAKANAAAAATQQAATTTATQTAAPDSKEPAKKAAAAQKEQPKEPAQPKETPAPSAKEKPKQDDLLSGAASGKGTLSSDPVF